MTAVGHHHYTINTETYFVSSKCCMVSMTFLFSPHIWPIIRKIKIIALKNFFKLLVLMLGFYCWKSFYFTWVAVKTSKKTSKNQDTFFLVSEVTMKFISKDSRKLNNKLLFAPITTTLQLILTQVLLNSSTQAPNFALLCLALKKVSLSNKRFYWVFIRCQWASIRSHLV